LSLFLPVRGTSALSRRLPRLLLRLLCLCLRLVPLPLLMRLLMLRLRARLSAPRPANTHYSVPLPHLRSCAAAESSHHAM
jgi:hypothetical protein